MIYYCIKPFQQFKVGYKFDLDNGYVINGLLKDEYISEKNPIKKEVKNVTKSNKNKNRSRSTKS